MFATISAIFSLAFEFVSKTVRAAYEFSCAFIRMVAALIEFGVLLALVVLFIRLILDLTGIWPAFV